jgi:hypothetical protein
MTDPVATAPVEPPEEQDQDDAWDGEVPEGQLYDTDSPGGCG